MTRQTSQRLPREVGVVVGFAATTATALLAAPAIASRLASELGLPPSDVGLYFTVEQAGMCLASLPAIWWLNRIAWRRVAAIAIGVFILANLLSTQAPDLRWLLPLRGASALSGGTLMVLSMTLAGRAAERERLFAFWTLGQLIVGASLLYLLPRAFAVFGLDFLYVLVAILAVANVPLLRLLPQAVQTPPLAPGSERSKDPRRLSTGALLGVGGVLLYYIGFGGLWPFLSSIAQSGGSTAIASGAVLSLAGLSGIAGALLAAARSRHEGSSPLVLGYAIHTVALLALVGAPELARFAIAAALLKGASNFTLPFILGRTSRLDRDGRLMGITNMAIGGGLAIGPLITGRVIEATGDFSALIGLTLAWLAASALLVLAIGTKWREDTSLPLSSTPPLEA